MEANKEEWRPVVGYEGFYEISSLGNVRSVIRKVEQSQSRYTEQRFVIRKSIILKLTLNPRGYMAVGLSKLGVQKTFMVHNLVARAFIKNPEGKKIVNHINLDKRDNSICNLEWVTASENILHAFCSGAKPKIRGSKNHMFGRFNELNHYSKGVIQYSLNGDIVREYPSAREAARCNCCSFKLISLCATGKRKTHNGFIWKFKN